MLYIAAHYLYSQMLIFRWYVNDFALVRAITRGLTTANGSHVSILSQKLVRAGGVVDPAKIVLSCCLITCKIW